MARSEHEGPERTCVGCRRRRAQRELVRCVLGADGRPVVSRTAGGRGAWLCDPPGRCFELAARRKAFERAWKRPVSNEALAELGRILVARAERRAAGCSEAAERGRSEAGPSRGPQKG